MQKKSYLFLFILINFSWLLFSCNNAKQEQDKTTSGIAFKTEVFLAPQDDSEQFIGSIAAISVDNQSNVYVLDRDRLIVMKYDTNGILVDTFGTGEGKGPGEFISPVDVAVDSARNVYVFDKTNAKVTVFNEAKEVLDEIIVRFIAAQIVVDSKQDIYLLGFPFSYSGPLVKKYSKNEKDRYRLVNEFVERPEVAKSREVKMSGNSDNMTIGSDGNLYYSFFYPYEIRKYSPDGTLLSTFTREDPPFSKPEFSGGIAIPNGGSREVIPLKGGMVINRTFFVNEPNYNLVFSMDIFNDGKFQQSRADSTLGIPERARYVASDNNNTIYFASNFPKPHIVRLVIE